MRVTFSAIQGNLEAINQAAAQFADAQQQVGTGKRVHRPSDNPTDMQRAIQDRSEIATIDAYTRASDTAGSRLAMMDGVLSAMIDRLTDATATATSARGTTPDPLSRTAASAKLATLRDSLAGDLNTQFRGTYVFAGSEAQSVPYTKDATTGVWSYGGDASPVSAAVGRNRSVTMTLDGQAIAQGADAADLFTELDALVIGVRDGDEAAIGRGIAALTRTFDRTVQAQSRIGNDEASTSDGQAQLVSLRIAGVARLSKDQDANMAEAVTRMNQAQIAYQAAIGAVGKSSKLSLLDYL
jgi:flagellar hook-associated protein 3 FlgL